MSSILHLLCHECGAFQRVPAMAAGARARCHRCSAVLCRNPSRSIERSLALTLAAIFLFAVANLFPFLRSELAGNVTETTLLTGVIDLYSEGLWLLALLVLVTVFIAPLLQLALQLYILAPLHFGRVAPGLRFALRIYRGAALWTMMDVFMLGTAVAAVKLLGLTEIHPGVGILAFTALVLALAASAYTMDVQKIWESIQPGAVSASANARAGVPVSCHTCGLVTRSSLHGGAHDRCERCGERLHRRIPRSVEKSWAYLLAAVALYVPANTLPIMTVTSLGKSESSTIMGGVIYLWLHDWPLAVIVFVASVVVPVAKMITLAVLLLSVQLRWQWRPVDRTRLYRIAELIGRWSMVDVYVVTLLVALVKMGGLASIHAEAGAIFFGGVVVATILAYLVFDSRLIWDRIRVAHG